MSNTDEIELDLLQRRARACNHYVNRHKAASPMGGDLYLQPAKRFRSEDVETLVRFATAKEIHAGLAQIEERQRAIVNHRKERKIPQNGPATRSRDLPLGTGHGSGEATPTASKWLCGQTTNDTRKKG
jgi:hypothetical protein